MNPFHSLLDDESDWLENMPAPTPRHKAIVRLDDDVFAPLDGQRGQDRRPCPDEPLAGGDALTPEGAWSTGRSLQSFFQYAGLDATAPFDEPHNSSRIDVFPDDECRRYKRLLSIALNRINALKSMMKEQSGELTLCCAQIAELCDKQNRQAAELQAAHEEREGLLESIAQLQDTVFQRETEAADAMRQLAQSDNDRLALQEQLNGALDQSAGLSRQLLEASSALNDKDTVIASTQEQLELLNTAVNETEAEQRAMEALIEQLNERHRGELDEQRAHFEERLARAQATIAKRDQEIKDLEAARSSLAERYNSLASSVGALEAAHRRTQEKLDSRARYIEVLENRLRVEREATARQMETLNAELERERSERAVAQRTLEAICKDIAVVLPDVAMQPVFDAAAARIKAA